MNREQKQAKRNQIVSELISIVLKYNCTYGECFFVVKEKKGVVSFCCDKVSRNVIREMEEMGLEINHIYFHKHQNYYKISFRYDYD